MTGESRTLRAVAWLCLAFGAGAAVALWVNVPQTVTTIETVGGHGTATFEGVERSLSGFFALMGGVALVAGLALWALLRGAARAVDALRSGAAPKVAPDREERAAV